MGGREEHRHRRNDGEHGEDDQAEAIDHHRGEFPVAYHLRLFVRLLHAIGNELQFPENVLEVALGARAGHGRFFDRGRMSHEAAAQGRGHGCVVTTGSGNVSEIVIDIQNVGQQTF